MSDTTAPTSATDDGVSFGPFRLYPARKLLVEGDKPVRLGSRALDLLIALVEAQGELVGKDDLIRESLARHLRRGGQPPRPSRGAAEGAWRRPRRRSLHRQRSRPRLPVRRTGSSGRAAPPPSRRRGATIHHLPASLLHIIGRDETVASVTTQLRERRFVTIVGPGGIGKTTVALAVAETRGERPSRRRTLCRPLAGDRPAAGPGRLASALGLAVTSQNPIAGLAAALATRDMLVVLDNCEHVIEAAAALAEGIVRGAGGVHVLATSREPLRAAGERVYRLGPLDLPSTSTGLTAEEAMRFPAVQLFVERASGERQRVRDGRCRYGAGDRRLPPARRHRARHRARGRPRRLLRVARPRRTPR